MDDWERVIAFLRLVWFGKRTTMVKPRVFISFDFDHDADLRNLLVGQAQNPDTPFEIKDRSLKEPLTGNWKDKVRQRMDNIDVVIVICGEATHKAAGVAAELAIAREERGRTSCCTVAATRLARSRRRPLSPTKCTSGRGTT